MDHHPGWYLAKEQTNFTPPYSGLGGKLELQTVHDFAEVLT
jgi:hypothetical protein